MRKMRKVAISMVKIYENLRYFQPVERPSEMSDLTAEACEAWHIFDVVPPEDGLPEIDYSKVAKVHM